MTTATIRAYLSNYSGYKATDLADMPQEKLAKILFITHMMMEPRDGYVEVGSVEVKVTLKPHEQMVTEAVASLRAQVQVVRAEAERTAMKLEGEISKLLAIGMTTDEVPA